MSSELKVITIQAANVELDRLCTVQGCLVEGMSGEWGLRWRPCCPDQVPSAQRGVSDEHGSARWAEVFSRAVVITVHNLHYYYFYS